MLNKSAAIAALMLALLVSGVRAQQQPAVADNNQDEQVNIPIHSEGKDEILSILRSGDKQTVNHYISRLIPLDKAQGAELSPFVFNAVRLEGGYARVISYSHPEEGKKYFIHVVTTREQMDSLEQTIRDLDLPGIRSDLGTSLYSVRLRYRKASEMKKLLDATTTTEIGLTYADDLVNTIHIQDSPSDTEYALSVLEFFDVPAPQVQFDIQVIETRESNVDELGLDWQAWKRNLSGDITTAFEWYEGSQSATNPRMDGLLNLDANVLGDFLNYAVQSGSADLKHHCKLTATNTKPAKASYERPLRMSWIENLDGERVLIESAKEGIEITITPTIGTDIANAAITIDTHIFNGYDQAGEPLVANQHFESEVNLAEDETFRLGTVERRTEVSFRNGIPGLKDIPVLKYLFSVEGRRSEKSIIHMLATPEYYNPVRFEARETEGYAVEELRLQRQALPSSILENMIGVDE